LDGTEPWRKTAGYINLLFNAYYELKLEQEFSQKKKPNTADTFQPQPGNKRMFSATGSQPSAGWQNESKFKTQRKGHQKKAKTSDSEFDIFS
jgi:hypothetical protein